MPKPKIIRESARYYSGFMGLHSYKVYQTNMIGIEVVHYITSISDADRQLQAEITRKLGRGKSVCFEIDGKFYLPRKIFKGVDI